MDWQDVINLGIDDKSDAELAALLPVLTSGPLGIEAVKAWLLSEGLWFEQSKTTMGGTLQSAADSNTDIAAILGQFYPAVFGGATGDGALHTNSPNLAPTYSAGLQGLKFAGLVDDDQIEAFYNLDGGRPWKDETEATIAAARLEYTTTETLRSDYAASASPVNQAAADVEPASLAGDRAALVAAIQGHAAALTTQAAAIEAE